MIGGIELQDQTPWNIVFNNEHGDEVGRLEFSESGKLSFKGKANASANVFFGCVVGANNLRMNQLKALLEEGVSVTDTVQDDHIIETWRRSVKDVLAISDD